MIELKNIDIAAGGTTVLDNLSLVVPAGKICCLTGAAGCGKTLLVRAMLGLWPVAAGYITFRGELITARSAPFLRQWMGYVPQLLPEGVADALDALADVDDEERRCLLLDDPFATLADSKQAEQLAERLATLAARDKAIVLTCRDEKVLGLLPTDRLLRFDLNQGHPATAPAATEQNHPANLADDPRPHP